ncbi:hypothetical protein MAFF211520_10840 [Ralstonia pseudosolanacearum]|nr:hypothetical protein MAFF211520_10840 [Ralstonia pseudosolanacearum]BEU56030.1 hypothetical protein MAFF211521_10830 [Ralstonia pseudosolanacearum]BEU63266.1 hypothetical protein MAFF301524_30660 [Ralstonia pseudosolanacearum]
MRDLSRAVVASNLRKAVDVWAEVQEILGVERSRAAAIVERAFNESDMDLYLNDQVLGLWFPCEDRDTKQQLMSDLALSDFALGRDDDAAAWSNWRLHPADCNLILNQVRSIAGHGVRPEPSNFLDPAHPRYAPKLAAAVSAWRAVEGGKGVSPKQAIAKWLREHAEEFGLSDANGKPNETGIEEVAKVANWQPTGGAPKTP